MNHLMKYEELEWKDINPFDKDKILTNKFKKAISKINISGVNLLKGKESNKQFETYISKISLDTKIDGCKSIELIITKFQLPNASIKCSLFFTFNNDKLLKILNSGRHYIPCECGFVPKINRYKSNKDICSLTIGNNFIISDQSTVDDLIKFTSDKIKELLNVDWKKIKNSIDKGCLEIDEERKKDEEINKKRQSITSKSDEISDLLIDLEDMSKSHKKEVNGDIINFIYEIPGIKVEETNYSSGYGRNVEFTNDIAKLVLTKELIDVMNAIEAFKKRLKDEAQDSEIKVHLKNDLVMIILTLPKNNNYNPRGYFNGGPGW